MPNKMNARSSPYSESQLAIEHGHRIREISDKTWVLWVCGATAAKFEESYRHIAKAVGIPGQSEKSTDTLRAVQDWLSNESNGKWVMIVDNADDMEVWTTSVQPIMSGAPVKMGQQNTPLSATRRLHSFLPDSRNGTILITSRNREFARLLTCNGRRGEEGLHCLSRDESRRAYEASHLR
jgi:hypothetical protein